MFQPSQPSTSEVPLHCASCNRSFSFLESFRILNPLRYKCPSCGALLTTGRFGWFSIGIGCLLGLFGAAVAIGMEEFRLWKTQDSFTWFAVYLPVVCVPFQWFWWRRARFILRQ